jgi:hypothetical protein
MHDWINILPLVKATLAAVTITIRIVLALLATRHRAATRAVHPLNPVDQPTPDAGAATAFRLNRISRGVDVALQLGQIVSAALTALEWLHRAGLL